MNICAKYQKWFNTRIDISEGIDFNKTTNSRECMICYYWYLKTLDLNISLMFVIDVMILA